MKTVRLLQYSVPLIVVALTAVVLLSRSASDPVDPEAIAGSWIGIADGDLYSVRMELDDTSAGYFCIGDTRPGGPAQLYYIEKWTRTKDNRIDFSLRAAKNGTEPVYLRAVYAANCLRIEYGYSNVKRAAKLVREQGFLAGSQQAKETIDRARTRAAATSGSAKPAVAAERAVRR